jgi:hypothetical protein
MLLSYNTGALGAAALEDAVRKLYEKDPAPVLSALAKAPGLAFDLDLAAAANSASPQSDNTLLLAACAVSGGTLTRDVLLDRARTPTQDWASARVKFWTAALALDHVTTAQSLLTFYALTPPGQYDLDHEPTALELVKTTIAVIRQNRDEALRLIPIFAAFMGMGAGETFGMPTAPPPQRCDGKRLVVLTAIADLLTELNSPASLSALTRLANLNPTQCPGLVARAAALDLRSLASEPWLIPRLTLAQEIPRSNWTLGSTRALGSQPIGLPRDLLLLDEASARTLNEWETTAAKMHLAVPTQAFSTSAADVMKAESRFADSAWKSLKQRFNLNGPAISIGTARSPTIPGAPAQPYFSFRRVHEALTRATADALRATGVPVGDSPNPLQPAPIVLQANILVDSELERRALVLLAIYASAKREPLSQPFDVAVADDLLDQLVTTKSLGVNTSTGHKILPDPSSAMPVVDCVAPTLRVVARALDLDGGMYEEALTLACPDGKEWPAKWIGAIPFPLQGPLRRHPRLLDFLDYSLAWRELRLEETPWTLQPTDIDYVRQNPELSISVLTGALLHPTVPAAHVRDAIVIGSDYGRNPLVTPVMAQGWAPRVPLVPRSLTTSPVPPDVPAPARVLLEAGVPGGIMFVGPHVAQTAQAFDEDKKRMKAPIDILLTTRANGIAAEQIRAAGAALPDECQVSNGVTDPLCLLFGWFKVTPPIKTAILANQELARRVGLKNGTQQYLSAWDLEPILTQPVQHVYLRDMVISPSFDAYGAIHELRFASASPRFIYTEGSLSLPAWAKVLIRANPNALAINDVDVSNVALHDDDRFGIVATRLLRIQSSADTLWNLLDQQSMVSLEESVADIPIDSHLEASPDGLSLARQQSWALQVRKFALGEALPTADEPRKEFVDSVRTNWASAMAQVKQTADSVAAPNLANIRAYQDARNQFTVYFQIGWGNGGVWTGGAVSLNGVGIGLSTSFQSSLQFQVVIGGTPIPIVDVHLPQTGPQAAYLSKEYDSQLALSVRSGDTKIQPPKSNLFDEAMNADPLLMGLSIRGANTTTPEFKRKEIDVANALGISPFFLMAVMSFESGHTFSPGVVNQAGSGATGLIQFMPKVAESLGTTVEKLAAMSAVEQLDYVKKYFEQYKDKLNKDHTLRDVYMAVLYPNAIGKGDNYVLFKKGTTAYEQNKQLDVNGDGRITAAEAAAFVDGMFIRPRTTTPIVFRRAAPVP